MSPTIDVYEPRPDTTTMDALQRVQATIRPYEPGIVAEVAIDGVPTPSSLHAGTDAVGLVAWCDTRGQAPGLHELEVTVRYPDGREQVASRFLQTVLGELPVLPPAPELTGPEPRVCRLDDPGLGDALADTATATGPAPLILVAPGAELLPGATAWLAHAFAGGEVDVAIGDEASPVGHRWLRWTKPAFQPEALPCLDQVGPVLAVGPRAAAVLRDAGPVPAGTYGLALELLDRGLRSLATERVLATTVEARLPVDDAEARAAVERLAARRGRSVVIGRGARTGLRDVRWPLAAPGPVVAVVPSRTPELAARCLQGLERTTDHPALRAVLVGSGPEQDALRAAAAAAAVPTDYVTFPEDEPFNYQRAVNLGWAAAPDGDVLFLNDDVVPLRPDWLVRMAELLSLPGVGIVGALLRYPDQRIQHAGVLVTTAPAHLHHHAPADAPGRHFDALVPGNPVAVTGACALVDRGLLAQLEGHDESFVQLFGDVDLCLRARRLGYRTAWCAAAELEHAESTTYKDHMDLHDHDRFTERWPDHVDGAASARLTT